MAAVVTVAVMAMARVMAVAVAVVRATVRVMATPRVTASPAREARGVSLVRVGTVGMVNPSTDTTGRVRKS